MDPKIWTVLFNLRVLRPKQAVRIANSVHSGQTAPRQDSLSKIFDHDGNQE